MSPRAAKHASEKRATCPPSHLHVTETRNVAIISQKHLRVSCKKSCRALQSFRDGKTGRHRGEINVARGMSPSLARPCKPSRISQTNRLLGQALVYLQTRRSQMRQVLRVRHTNFTTLSLHEFHLVI